jgi:para-aminobenzoate synthetase component I
MLLDYAAEHFDTFSFLNDNDIAYPNGGFSNMIAMGALDMFTVAYDDIFSWSGLDAFIALHQKQYIIGYFNYQLKNKIECFNVELTDALNFPLIQLYVPQFLFTKSEQHTWQPYDDASNELLLKIAHYEKKSTNNPKHISDETEQFSRQEYLTNVSRIKRELAQGNIYEMNFCTNYNGTFRNINFTNVYEILNKISPMPFSALHKHKEHTLVSASPERFIKKTGNKLISQPIKGTAGRKTDAQEDIAQISRLENSLKERTENIMIVDLVRNDLSKICEGGSVVVKELCKAYSFKKVHQLISTIEGQLEDRYTPLSEIIKALFPMGSMTGAPKYKAMQLIDELEVEGRGLFSGTLGYISPNGDFDFNVIIRSILFNDQSGQYQYHAGSAITIASDAELEYQECRIKTLPIRMLLEHLRNEA